MSGLMNSYLENATLSPVEFLDIPNQLLKAGLRRRVRQSHHKPTALLKQQGGIDPIGYDILEIDMHHSVDAEYGVDSPDQALRFQQSEHGVRALKVELGQYESLAVNVIS